MTEKEAILARHSVRKYTSKAIDADVAAKINEKVAEVNAESGLHFQFLNHPRKVIKLRINFIAQKNKMQKKINYINQ